MKEEFRRLIMLIGKENFLKLKNSNIVIAGIGGVGSFSAESLARSGVGRLTLIDYDTIDITNINRQIHANTKTIGKFKTDIMKKRILDINPDCNVTNLNIKITKENLNLFLNDSVDYVIDAIDMVSSKLDLIVACKSKNIKIISSMGTGNKLNPSDLEVTDIKKTTICPLARVMRRELKRRNINSLKVVYSTEKPATPLEFDENFNIIQTDSRKKTPASNSFVPASAGLLITSEVIKDLINN